MAPATENEILRAAAHIRAGELVAFPTETVYGLGANATNGEAVARIFAAKGRPHFNPLIVHVARLQDAEALASFSPLAYQLAEHFWPGPLTLVLPRRPGTNLSELVTAGLDTVALRMPAHPIARALIAAAQRPLAAPSANISGHVSPTRAAHVAADLGDKVAMILDGGDTRHGLESAVVTIANDTIVLLRPGAITAAALTEATGAPVTRAFDGGATPASPGQLASHYAPKARVRLGVGDPAPGEALLAFGPHAPTHQGPTINLSPSGDLIEAAARLFSALRELDATGASAIAVMPIPAEGLGEAINDRLKRAASPR
ncbi:MAG: threonylcarbamoyl-AMP synthase [Hyphomicrobiaceae bacterium]|nr:threonylcarbamoyl-AMP synthase [Hyphomicrobiaceae bacterium]